MLIVALGIGAVSAAVGGVWNSQAPLQGKGFSASVIGGKIYVSHGYRPGDSAILSIYDIATNTWSGGPSATVPTSELVGQPLAAVTMQSGFVPLL